MFYISHLFICLFCVFFFLGGVEILRFSFKKRKENSFQPEFFSNLSVNNKIVFKLIKLLYVIFYIIHKKLGSLAWIMKLVKKINSEYLQVAIDLYMLVGFWWIPINKFSFWLSGLPHNNPVGWSCKIHQLCLGRGIKPLLQREYDTNPSDDETPILELWRIWSTPPLTLLTSPLRQGVPDIVPSMG